ncbi:condensation domain-containing protein, partial [Sphaerisporangium sp. TRM90804]|uniref:condensation domain-containing protein n=1 Tax=Sphaerisporangium sp. TRM90804 TaxID=3031113 RepID=UPI0024491715
DDLVGFFVNTLVLRTDTSGEPTFAELLGRARETALAAYANQDVPFEYLVEVLNPVRSMTRSPLFQVSLGYQNEPLEPFSGPGLESVPEEGLTGTSRFDLAVHVQGRSHGNDPADGYIGFVEYNTDIYHEGSVRRFVDLYRRLLTAVVADHDLRIDRIDLLGPEEWGALVPLTVTPAHLASLTAPAAPIDASPADISAVDASQAPTSAGPVNGTVDGVAPRDGGGELHGYVLDPWLGPVPPGIPGELYLAAGRSSAAPAHGPAMPAELRPDVAETPLDQGLVRPETLVADPFGPPGSRMYRSGLRVRWDAALRRLEPAPAWPEDLPPSEDGATAPARPQDGPATRAEEILCAVFAEVLGLDEVDPEENFFALGFHSLLATQVVSRIRVLLGVEPAIRTLFEAPTVAELAECLEETGRVQAPLTRRERPERVPLSFAQRRLWFLHRLEGPNATYNVPWSLRLRGELDVDALRAAMGDVLARHESLRTVFPEHEGTPYQRVLAPGDTGPMPATVEHVAEEDIQATLDAAARDTFDLAREIPVRTRLWRVGPRDHVLMVMLHHIVSDAWSFAPLSRDLMAAYEARLAGRAPAFTGLPVQYADYALWQREVLGDEGVADGGRLGPQVAYWRERLAGLPEQIVLPVDR